MTSAGSPAGGGTATGPVTVQSNLSAPSAKAAMQALIDGFNKKGGAQASLNTVAAETFRTQLLAGRHSFADPQVHKVFDQWETALPHFDPKGTALSFQDATTNLLQSRTGPLDGAPALSARLPRLRLSGLDPSARYGEYSGPI